MNPILMTLANDNARELAAMSMEKPLSFRLPAIDLGKMHQAIRGWMAAFGGRRVQAA